MITRSMIRLSKNAFNAPIINISKPLGVLQFKNGDEGTVEGLVEGTLPMNGVGVATGQFAEGKLCLMSVCKPCI